MTEDSVGKIKRFIKHAEERNPMVGKSFYVNGDDTEDIQAMSIISQVMDGIAWDEQDRKAIAEWFHIRYK